MNPPELTSLLKRHRGQRSYRDMANLLHEHGYRCTGSTIGNWERGKSAPGNAALCAYVAALDLKPAEAAILFAAGGVPRPLLGLS